MRINSKIQSVKKSSDFKRILDQNNKMVAKSLIVFCSPLQDDSATSVRLGLVVSKKNGIAVVRNRIKRRLRAAFSYLVSKYDIKNTDIVIIARKPSYDVKFEDLLRDFSYCLKKINII